jgi:hypothetical protein
MSIFFSSGGVIDTKPHPVTGSTWFQGLLQIACTPELRSPQRIALASSLRKSVALDQIDLADPFNRQIKLRFAAKYKDNPPIRGPTITLVPRYSFTLLTFSIDLEHCPSFFCGPRQLGISPTLWRAEYSKHHQIETCHPKVRL